MPARIWAFPRAFDSALIMKHSSPALVASPRIQSQWSRQDVLTLAGVCVAIITVLIALLSVMFPPPKLRKWLCRSFHWITRRLRPSKSSHVASNASLLDALDVESLLPLSSPSSRQPMIIENWKNTDPRVVRQQWQERYNESLRVRRGGFWQRIKKTGHNTIQYGFDDYRDRVGWRRDFMRRIMGIYLAGFPFFLVRIRELEVIPLVAFDPLVLMFLPWVPASSSHLLRTEKNVSYNILKHCLLRQVLTNETSFVSHFVVAG